MDSLKPSDFFLLDHFPFQKLFEGLDHVWEALKRLKPFLDSFDGGIPLNPENFPGAHFENADKIFLGKDCHIEPGAFIRGPCVLGDSCEVRHGAYLRGYLVAGNNCVLGHDTEVKHSILLNGAQASHFAYVGDCIFGNDVNLGAGTKCANLRLDRREIAFWHGGKKYRTGLKKMGAVLGDGVQTGCNSVTNPGTFMGPKSALLPCCNTGGIVEPGLISKGGQRPGPRKRENAKSL